MEQLCKSEYMQKIVSYIRAATCLRETIPTTLDATNKPNIRPCPLSLFAQNISCATNLHSPALDFTRIIHSSYVGSRVTRGCWVGKAAIAAASGIAGVLKRVAAYH